MNVMSSWLPGAFFYLLYYFPHSLYRNSIGDEGAVAIAAAVKTMNSLQLLR